MKEGLIATLLLVMVGTSGYYAYKNYYQVDEYYTKIYTKGKKVTLQSENGDIFTRYQYKLESFKSPNYSKEIDLISLEEQPLKQDSYVKITYSRHDGVTFFEEIKEVPSEIKSTVDSLY